MDIKRLKEENAEIASRMEAAITASNTDDATDEQIRSNNDTFQQLETEYQSNLLKIETAEKAERFAALTKRSVNVDMDRPNKYGNSARDHDLAFRASLLESVGFAAPSDWNSIRAKVAYSGDFKIRSGQTVGTASEGGNLAHTELANWIEKATKFFGGVKEVCRTYNTSTGQDLYLPTFDNTSGTSASHAENATVTSADKTFGRVTIKAQSNATACYPVSVELIRDASFNVSELIGSALGEDIARFQNNKLTVGSGTSGDAAWNGIVTASTQGKVAAATNAVTWLEIMDLIASLDYSYISSPNFGLMMHYSTYSKLLQLVDTTNRPLFLTAITDAGKKTLGGFPIYINNDMASSFAANAKIVLAGDFSKFVNREVTAISVATLKERFADQLAVGFTAWHSFGCNCVNTAAIKHLKLAAS